MRQLLNIGLKTFNYPISTYLAFSLYQIPFMEVDKTDRELSHLTKGGDLEESGEKQLAGKDMLYKAK